MPKFEVTLPITGTISISSPIEADTEEEAIEKAWELYEDGWESHFEAPGDWEAIDKIVEGNVFHGIQNEAEASEVKG